MSKLNFKKTQVILALALSIFLNQANAQLLAVSGQKIVNTANNQEVILNAINFGNWMLMEGYMMNSANQAPSQHVWKEKLTTLIGSEKTKAFYDAWLANHVTQADINQVKTWGFNAVRLPLHYEYFVNLNTPDVWNNQGFALLDSVIAWCAAAKIYAIIDLHGAPGGQSDNAISDYDNTKPSLWTSEANKDKTVRLWQRLSERYKNQAWVAGYDLLNEPAWNLPGGSDLRSIYGRLTDAVRGNGDNHIVFIEGNWYSNDYTGLTPAWDANMVYVFHKYWSNTSDEDIRWVLDLRTQQNRPIWCGEHGENSNTHFTKITELLKRNNIGTSWWPMKKFQAINDFADAQWPAGYQNLLNYFGGTNPGLSPTAATAILAELAENVKLSNCKLQSELVRAIITQPGNRNTDIFAAHSIPGRIYATNFDQGLNGYAYSDNDWEDVRLTTGIYSLWNNGWVYRNNGVDMEACTDSLSNGYNVGWFNKDEWMLYTCNVLSAGTYTIECRIANGGNSYGTIQIQNADGTKILGIATVPTTGAWNKWLTVTCTGGFNTTGVQKIRIVNANGSFNVASVNFVFVNAVIPVTTPVPTFLKVVSLKGNNEKYVTFSGANNLMTCTSGFVGGAEEWALVDAGNGLYALKGNNNLYVSLNPSERKLYCNSSNIGTNEKFTLENLNGVYSFKGSNNLFVSSENGSTAGLSCTRTAAAAWEFFNLNIVRMLATSIPNVSAATFKIFPNPTQTALNISSPKDRNAALFIYDMTGRILIHSTFMGKQKSIDVSNISSGLYILNLIEDNKMETVKFSKEK